MSEQIITQLLKRVEIFREIPEKLLCQLAERLSMDSFVAGSTIIQKGDEGNSMFVIVQGKVKVHDAEHTVATMESENFFGEFSLLDEAPRSMSVTAIEETSLLKISRELFFELLQSQPDVAKKIISALTNRLRGQNDAIIKQLRTREEELSRLVDERTRELKLRNEEITIKNREITDNVNYARRIQHAILPDYSSINNSFEQSFVLYLPKDIVSGDFYSFFPREENAIIIAADCTGHGVTGAFLSVVGNSLLTRIIGENKVQDPGEILDQLHEAVIETLNQRNGDSTDGMDISICNYNFKSKILRYAGANRPLWIIRDGEIIIHSPNKFPIGGIQIKHDENFKSHEIQLKSQDSFYIFSDGYADQFGGDRGKKLMTKKLKELLLEIQSLEMSKQHEFLQNYFNRWKGEREQVDDVLLIGIKV